MDKFLVRLFGKKYINPECLGGYGFAFKSIINNKEANSSNLMHINEEEYQYMLDKFDEIEFLIKRKDKKSFEKLEEYLNINFSEAPRFMRKPLAKDILTRMRDYLNIVEKADKKIGWGASYNENDTYITQKHDEQSSQRAFKLINAIEKKFDIDSTYGGGLL